MHAYPSEHRRGCGLSGTLTQACPGAQTHLPVLFTHKPSSMQEDGDLLSPI